MGLLSNALDALFKKRTNAASLSGAMVPIVTNVGTAGNPQYAIAGIDSMANLASVLGGTTTPISQNDNIDNYRNYGRFTCLSNAVAGTLTGLPSGYNGGGFILFVLPSSQPDNGFRIQLIINYRCTVVYIRAYQSNVWDGWRTITTNAV